MDVESQTVEWKESWRDEYLKWVCAFANTEGGVLEIGRRDDGEVIGVPDACRLLEDIPSKVNAAMAIIVDVDLKTTDDIDYLTITVRPYPNPISYHGKYYVRSGSTTRELTGNALYEFILRKQGQTWDGVPVPNVQVTDLDIVAFRDFRRKALSSDRLAQADLDISDTALMDSLQLAEGAYLKRAAVLLFHEHPEKFVTGPYVRIGLIDTDLRYFDEVGGPILTLADKVLDLIYTKYFHMAIRYEGIQRIENYPVPREALREAVLNAIVHKDYSTGIPIQIRVHPDSIVIANPGQLPAGWTVTDLISQHMSLSRNPDIANVFFRSGQIETWGRGIQRIEQACAAVNSPSPVYQANGSTVEATFSYNPVYLRDEAAGAHNPVRGKSDDLTIYPVVYTDGSVGVNDGVNVGKDAHFTDVQQQILTLMRNNPAVTTPELASTVGLSERRVTANIRTLREAGLVARIGAPKNGYWQVAS